MILSFLSILYDLKFDIEGLHYIPNLAGAAKNSPNLNLEDLIISNFLQIGKHLKKCDQDLFLNNYVLDFLYVLDLFLFSLIFALAEIVDKDSR